MRQKGKKITTTKEKILLVTLKLASENGLGSLSLSHIAGEVGIQKQSLYNHFASKEELINCLYEYLRGKAKEKANMAPVDYGVMVKGKKPVEILTAAVDSYMRMNQDNDMIQFYRFVMSERSINKEAAQIMVAETEKMILATKQLFYAMQVQHVMEFDDADAAAFSFAMAVHAIMDYMYDREMAGADQRARCAQKAEITQTAKKQMDTYIEDFCMAYSNKKSNADDKCCDIGISIRHDIKK